MNEKAARRLLLAAIPQRLESNYLNALPSMVKAFSPSTVTRDQFERMRQTFVRAWTERETGITLDAEQAAAVADVDGHVQVVARAGSGKTRTIVARALFLQRHCAVQPEEMLLLAFNRKAAEEMRTRLQQSIEGPIPHVMTFHALAYALVHPDEQLLFDDTSADQLGLSREIQHVIDEHIRGATTGPLVRSVMLAHFRADWAEIVRRGFDQSVNDFLARRRALTSESLAGDFVKSYGEKLIANTLFEHDIDYFYESNFRWGGDNYRPDFLIPTGPNAGVVIEYFGLKGDPSYDDQIERKRAFWQTRPDWTLIERFPADVASTDSAEFARRLIAELDMPARRLTEEEIWTRVASRAIDRFTGAVTGFIGRCRKQNLSPPQLRDLVGRHVAASPVESQFLELAASIYSGYLDRLRTNQGEDFDGLMWRAVEAVRGGSTRFSRGGGREQGDLARVRFAMIDEFQDFSQMFLELTQAMINANPNLRLFAVGDDWQAINGFAGSDLRYFQRFDRYFPGATRRAIRTNYRSARSVVAAGNAVMHDLGLPSKPKATDLGETKIWLLDSFEPTAEEQRVHDRDEITPAVLRLVTDMLRRGLDVVMLSRRNSVPWHVRWADEVMRTPRQMRFLEHIRSHLPEEERHRVEFSTTHKYKGLEQPGVIILDAVERSYPLIHPNWVFQRALGDTVERIEAEERRLFYVAVTRAAHSLALVTESRQSSPYLETIEIRTSAQVADWSSLPPAPSIDGRRVEIRVLGGYDVRDTLKSKGYRFSAKGKYWSKSVLADDFTLHLLRRQEWTASCGAIEIRNESGKVIHRLAPGQPDGH